MAHIIKARQGTPEWHQHRAVHFNASDAPAMMGCSPFKSRTQLLDEKATGITPEVDAATQKRFDDGHRCEELARPFAEDIIEEELYPVVLADDIGGLPLSASYDGLTMDDSASWEHKRLNDELRRVLDNNEELPEHYRIQMEQGFIVRGHSRCLFMASDGTAEEARHRWYMSAPDLATRIIAGWKQFDADLKNHVPAEPEKLVTGTAPESLPALDIRVSGSVVASNLDQFKQHAMAVFDNISTDLQTDEDFASAEATVKWCHTVEKRLEGAKDAALNQTADIYAVLQSIDEIKESARQKRLELDKLVKAEKESRKRDILRDAEHDYDAHLEAIGRELEAASGQAIRFPAPSPGIQEALKGKRTISSLQDAASTAVANAKIAADQVARGIRESIVALQESAQGHETLFPDGGQLVVSKSADDVRNLAAARIAEHKEREEQRRIQEANNRKQAEEAERGKAGQLRELEQPRAVAAEPASVQSPVEEKPPAKQANRPTDAQIVAAVASAFGVSNGVAADWIAGMSFEDTLA